MTANFILKILQFDLNIDQYFNYYFAAFYLLLEFLEKIGIGKASRVK